VTFDRPGADDDFPALHLQLGSFSSRSASRGVIGSSAAAVIVALRKEPWGIRREGETSLRWRLPRGLLDTRVATTLFQAQTRFCFTQKRTFVHFEIAMPKIRSEDLEQRRQELLDRCVACFATKGFHQTSMRELSAELGISLGGLYTYFKSKEAVIQGFIDQNRAKARELFDAVTPEMTFQEGLKKMGEMKMQAMSQEDEWKSCAVWMQINAEAVINPKVRKLVAKFHQYAEDTLAAMIDAAQLRGELRADFRAPQLARLLIYFGDGFDIGRIVSPKDDPKGEVLLFFRLVEAGFSRIPRSAPRRRRP
jgi:TetR/AcrR family transcriptional regulator, transcriptional repressor of aconitase